MRDRQAPTRAIDVLNYPAGSLSPILSPRRDTAALTSEHAHAETRLDPLATLGTGLYELAGEAPQEGTLSWQSHF